MKEKEILEFKNFLSNLSLEELEEERKKINEGIAKMILNDSLIKKATLINEFIEAKKGKK